MKTLLNTRTWTLALCVIAAVFTIAASTSLAADKAEPVAKTLFTNVNVFDGKNEKLIKNANVLIEGNLIKQVSTKAIKAEGATVIDGKGRTLIPGLIDAHYHPMFAAIGQMDALTSMDGYLNLVAAKNAEQLLLQGFTTVREASGNSFSLKRAIDQGLYSGPRIYPTGPMISQTSGHADY
jgi:imidazolonepropionase-like amidohydrolase